MDAVCCCSDVEEKLRKKCFLKNTPATHHVVFFYGYGSNSFSAVPFKNVEDWTPENMDKFRKLIAKGPLHHTTLSMLLCGCLCVC